jgi:hypothetical protein
MTASSTISTPNPTLREIVTAGASAEGSGALTGWNGLGSLTRSEILAALDEAGLPASWAPRSKSPVGHAGKAISALSGYGYIVRRARSASWRDASAADRAQADASGDVVITKVRAYRARWTVAASSAADATIGESAGRVVLTAELRDGSDELVLEGDTRLAAEVSEHYRTLRDGDVFDAGDVTHWLRGVLVRECGATRYAMGYYVPQGGRERAAKLAAAMAHRWGANWASPPLPVATSDELRAGIARAFTDEVQGVARSLETAREAARREDKAEISAGVAARLLRELGDVDARTATYLALCGQEVLAETITALRELREILRPLAGDVSMRFAMLELDGPVQAAPARKATRQDVERAISERSAELGHPVDVITSPAPAEPSVEELRARYRAAMERSGIASAAEFRSLCLSEGRPNTPAEWAQAAEALADRLTRFNAAQTTEEPQAPARAPVSAATEYLARQTAQHALRGGANRKERIEAPVPVKAPAPASKDIEAAQERFGLLELD